MREGLVHAWEHLQETVDSERPPPEDNATRGDDDEAAAGLTADYPLYRMKFEIGIPPAEEGKGAAQQTTSLAELPEDSKEQVMAMTDSARAQMKA